MPLWSCSVTWCVGYLLLPNKLSQVLPPKFPLSVSSGQEFTWALAGASGCACVCVGGEVSQSWSSFCGGLHNGPPNSQALIPGAGESDVDPYEISARERLHDEAPFHFLTNELSNQASICNCFTSSRSSHPVERLAFDPKTADRTLGRAKS